MKKMSKKELAKFMKDKLAKTKVTDNSKYQGDFFTVGTGEIKSQNNFVRKPT